MVKFSWRETKPPFSFAVSIAVAADVVLGNQSQNAASRSCKTGCDFPAHESLRYGLCGCHMVRAFCLQAPEKTFYGRIAPTIAALAHALRDPQGIRYPDSRQICVQNIARPDQNGTSVSKYPDYAFA